MKRTLTTLLAAAACAAAFAQQPAPAADAAAPNPKTPAMQIDDLLSGAGAFFLATADGDQPKLRPLGAHHVVDGKVWLGVGEFKNVYRQLVANPKCEVVALQPEGGKWLRWTGRAVFAEGAEREKLEEVFLEGAPGLRKIYDKSPGKRMMCFTLADARAELIPLMPPGEVLLDETAPAAPAPRKALVACFSATGTTKGVAERLAAAIGADFFEIVPEKPYTAADLDWRDKKSRSSVEMADRASRPALSGSAPALADYGTVYVGFPIWWYREPSIVDTFVESNAAALAGKTVVPFATSGGSGMGDSTKNLQALAPDAKVAEGRRFRADVSADDLKAWAAGF